ncbi:MAG: TIGR03790 family protein [Burkholderiales bacterium]|nr:TIGR03790 family protein [Burkholderiales bacterium]
MPLLAAALAACAGPAAQSASTVPEPRAASTPPDATARPASAPAPAGIRSADAPNPNPAGPAAAPARRWLPVPLAAGRLRARDLGLVINRADPYSVAVGEHYRRARGLRPQQVLEVELPLQPQLGPQELAALRERIDAHFGDRVQALALAWVQPFAVRCNSLAAALALGFDAALCDDSCGRPRATSPYFGSASLRPWQDHRMRLAMHLAAPSAEQALALIERGVASDGALRRRGAPTATALFVSTPDRARNVRATLYPPAGALPAQPSAKPGSRRAPPPQPSSVIARDAELDTMAGHGPLLLLQLGIAVVPGMERLRFVPGALADHLTSTGGRLDGSSPQTNALAWIAAGATASHGTVSEPCNHLQKFPHPQILLAHLAGGATAIEAYWRSVAWPQQSAFVGEPLAAPYAW